MTNLWNVKIQVKYNIQQISSYPAEKNVFLTVIFFTRTFINSGPGSSVGLTTGYGLEGPAIESRRGEIFRTCPDRPCSPPSLLYNGYRVFPGGRMRPGRDADPSPLLMPRSKNRVDYTPTLPKGLRSLEKG
jgi:hypothetical protein